MIQTLVHTCRGLRCYNLIEINVKRQSNPSPLKVFSSQAQFFQNIISKSVCLLGTTARVIRVEAPFGEGYTFHILLLFPIPSVLSSSVAYPPSSRPLLIILRVLLLPLSHTYRPLVLFLISTVLLSSFSYPPSSRPFSQCPPLSCLLPSSRSLCFTLLSLVLFLISSVLSFSFSHPSLRRLYPTHLHIVLFIPPTFLSFSCSYPPSSFSHPIVLLTSYSHHPASQESVNNVRQSYRCYLY